MVVKNNLDGTICRRGLFAMPAFSGAFCSFLFWFPVRAQVRPSSSRGPFWGKGRPLPSRGPASPHCVVLGPGLALPAGLGGEAGHGADYFHHRLQKALGHAVLAATQNPAPDRYLRLLPLLTALDATDVLMVCACVRVCACVHACVQAGGRQGNLLGTRGLLSIDSLSTPMTPSPFAQVSTPTFGGWWL